MDTMGGAETLNEEAASTAPVTSGVCPCCEESWGGLPHAETRAFPEIPLRRCQRCGCRFAAVNGAVRLLVSCVTCSLPFLTGDRNAPTDQRCKDCNGGRVPVDLPEPQLVAAAEQEVRDALDEVWAFAHSPALASYLNRLARLLAARIDGAPRQPQVALLDDAATKMLALPSGLMILSVGTLASIEDEAELAFVLAHELVHAARGDAALRLVRQGLLNIAHSQDAVHEVWRSAVDDMLALGYGRRRELQADDRAFEAVSRAGYDPHSVIRWLSRMEQRVSDADPQLRGYFLSHPPPSRRRRRFQEALAGSLETLGSRVNREVYRRAAGPEVLASALRRVDGLDQACDVDKEAADETPTRFSPALWLAIGAALTASIVVLMFLFG